MGFGTTKRCRAFGALLKIPTGERSRIWALQHISPQGVVPLIV